MTKFSNGFLNMLNQKEVYNQNENIESKTKEIDLCKKAIELYLTSMAEFEKRKITDDIKEYCKHESLQHSKSLATQSNGLRIGAPGWPHAKLIYVISSEKEEKYFSVDPNGMNEKKFKEWQLFIGEKFKENNLNFYYL